MEKASYKEQGFRLCRENSAKENLRLLLAVILLPLIGVGISLTAIHIGREVNALAACLFLLMVPVTVYLSFRIASPPTPKGN